MRYATGTDSRELIALNALRLLFDPVVIIHYSSALYGGMEFSKGSVLHGPDRVQDICVSVCT